MSLYADEMPYKRDPGRCDLCGRETPALRRIVLRESSGSAAAKNYKQPRLAYVCDSHDDAGGPIIKSPHSTMAEGTSRLRPQGETLL